MEPTPPPYRRSEPSNRTKSASRISKLRCYNADNEVASPNLSLEIVPSSPVVIASPSSSTPSKSPYGLLPMHELLKFSPSPLRRSSRTRLAQAGKVDTADENGVEQQGAKRRSKNKNYGMGLLGYASSPRNNRKSRKRVDQDVREEKDLGVGEELIRPRKKRQSGRSKKDKLSSVPSTPSPKAKEEQGSNLDRIKQVISDLIMWKDVAKSTLWFGFGSIGFLSSCFASGIKFSIFSAISQLGLLFLVFSFFSNSVRPRDVYGNTSEFKLKEEDILRVGRSIIPAANLVISKTRELFSGEPEMTLKVVPFLLVGAEFGHLITLWRLFTLGFFISFTCPKLCSCYSVQISKKVEYMNSRVLEKWESCSHKKIVAASALTAFWNLTSIRTRIFAAFISLVILRYYRQHSDTKVEEEIVDCEKVGHKQNSEAEVDEEEETIDGEKMEEKQALIVVKKGSS